MQPACEQKLYNEVNVAVGIRGKTGVVYAGRAIATAAQSRKMLHVLIAQLSLLIIAPRRCAAFPKVVGVSPNYSLHSAVSIRNLT